MNWQQQWIDEVLSGIPGGGYRSRAEAELRDHLETQCRALMEAGRTEDEARGEAFRVMGAPEALQREYMAAWRRSWPARLEELDRRLRAWAGGLAVMFGAQLLVCCVRDPSDSLFFSQFLPLLCALIVGALYLGRKFRTSRLPAAPISAGLCVHCAYLTAIGIWWEAADDHRTFWEELKIYLFYYAGYYALTLALCVLLGIVFGYLSKRDSRPAAA